MYPCAGTDIPPHPFEGGSPVVVIDADCHVIEPEQTWDYFDDDEVRYKPLALVPAHGNGNDQRFLSIDGRLRATSGGEDPRGNNRAIREDLSGFTRTSEAM